MKLYKIDLKNYYNNNYTALVGRSNGEALLKKLKKDNIILKEIEREYEQIQILIPDHIVTMNKSFFLGFLETRVQENGRERFKRLYKFLNNHHIEELISHEYIDAALGTLSPRDIFNA